MDEGNGQIDNVKRFWTSMEPVFQFLSKDEVTNILQFDAEENDVNIPIFGTSDSEPEEIEKNTKYSFAETHPTIMENHNCPICQNSLRYKTSLQKWSCDDFHHFGPNDFAKNRSAYFCANDDCNIAVCMDCHQRMASSKNNNADLEPWLMFRKNSVASRLMSAYIHPATTCWDWAKDNSKPNLEPPVKNVPTYNSHHHQTHSMKKKKKSSSNNDIENLTFEERLRLELKNNSLWNSKTAKLEFQNRQDDELCSVLREKFLILRGYLKKAKEFKNKILKRSETYVDRPLQTICLKKAQEEFIRVTQDEKSTTQQIEEAVASFEKAEKEVGTNLASLLQTEWLDK